MIVTNQTTEDYWFGPLHLPAGIGQQLTVDDTSDTSLYLTSDVVADRLNNLYLAGKITVSGEASPFPRPTGTPQLVHGDGSPEGAVLAPQGSAFLRRDIGSAATAVYVKTTGVTISTGWEPLAGGATPAGTAFPGAPSDGDEYVYVADAAGGVFWRFRYDATGSYWAFVGGAPLSMYVAGPDSINSATWASILVGSIVPPFTATYRVRLSCAINVQPSQAAGWAAFGDSSLSGEPVASAPIYVEASAMCGTGDLGTGIYDYDDVAAEDTLSLSGGTSYRPFGLGTYSYYKRYRAAILPVRT